MILLILSRGKMVSALLNRMKLSDWLSLDRHSFLGGETGARLAGGASYHRLLEKFLSNTPKTAKI